MPKEKIKVLVVDDSALVRRTLNDILNSDPQIEVIATAADYNPGCGDASYGWTDLLEETDVPASHTGGHVLQPYRTEFRNSHESVGIRRCGNYH